jgi:hypothetical protein
MVAVVLILLLNIRHLMEVIVPTLLHLPKHYLMVIHLNNNNNKDNNNTLNKVIQVNKDIQANNNNSTLLLYLNLNQVVCLQA